MTLEVAMETLADQKVNHVLANHADDHEESIKI